jgi:uncharacterized protein
MLLPEHSSWAAYWNTDKTKPYELYIDIIHLIKADSTEIAMIDLDLDVARTWKGRIEILDRDEFELHQKTLRYPRDIVKQAEKPVSLLETLVRNGEGPFGDAGNAWRARAIGS